MQSKPHILIISSWAPPMVGGPQNLYNLFSQFPEQSFSILTSFQATHAAAGPTGTALGCEYEYFDSPHPPGPWRAPDISHVSPADTGRSYPAGFRTLITLFATPIKVFLMVRKAVRSVRRNRSTVILGISDHGPALIATAITGMLTRRPYVFYLFDLYRGNNFSGLDRVFAKLLEGVLFRGAAKIILTNEGTEHLYRKRYGNRIRTAVIHNATFPELFTVGASYDPKPPFTITFTGNIYWAQEQAVLNLIHALDHLQDLPVQLKLYCPTPTVAVQNAIKGKTNIWIGAAPQAEMPKVQSDATLLFLPLAWHTTAPEIIATATPGKFTDYLAAGRPMLIHAPHYAYVSTYSREHTLGLVVDQDNPVALADAIRNFLANPEVGKSYISNALRIFQKNHDARKNAKKLTEILNMV